MSMLDLLKELNSSLMEKLAAAEERNEKLQTRIGNMEMEARTMAADRAK